MYPRILICAEHQFNSSVGIHLNDPTMQTIELALEDADTKGFEVIYAHFELTSGSGIHFKIKSETLSALFRLTQRDGVLVYVADPNIK